MYCYWYTDFLLIVSYIIPLISCSVSRYSSQMSGEIIYAILLLALIFSATNMLCVRFPHYQSVIQTFASSLSKVCFIYVVMVTCMYAE